MKMSDAEIARVLRLRAERVRDAADALAGRAEELRGSTMQRLLTLQAAMLKEGAENLESRALEVDPVQGRA
ncbi:MAG: hypothetical protein P4L64_17265 [Caulobacteraceae bacterium]|nr:hypothetical protein [Caulobacteraceae bacterium]